MSRVDIEFLKYVREVSDNPEEYDIQGEAEGPVTSRFLMNATSLSHGQVHYRLARESDGRPSRGFAADGLIRVYDGMLQPNGEDGPKSCEITDEGRRVLSEAEDNFAGSVVFGQEDSPSDDDRLDQIEQDIERLDNQFSALGEKVTEATEQMDELSSTLQEIQENDHGALDDEIVDKLDRLADAMIAHNNTFDFVFGADVEAFHPKDKERVNAKELARWRQHVLDTLQTTSADGVKEMFQEQSGE